MVLKRKKYRIIVKYLIIEFFLIGSLKISIQPAKTDSNLEIETATGLKNEYNTYTLSQNSLISPPVKNMSFTDAIYSNSFESLKKTVDTDINGMSDEVSVIINQFLESKIDPANQNLKAQSTEKIKIIVVFQGEPSQAFYIKLNELGILQTEPWRDVLYGFSAEIITEQLVLLKETIVTFGLQNYSYIEKDNIQEANMYIHAKQMNVRPYVWDTLGYTGDPSATIAIIDTGIDDTHTNHEGYGDQNFAEKIVGWYDATPLASSTPIDDGSHGSHCAGIAAGTGFETADDFDRLSHTTPVDYNDTGYSYDPGEYYLDVVHFNVTTPGTILIEADFLDKTQLQTPTSYVYGGFGLYKGTTMVAQASYQAGSSWNNRWLTYDVTSDNIGLYNITCELYLGASSGYCNDPAFSMPISFWIPYTTPTDGHLMFTGIAPDSRLMGIKVLSKEGWGQDSWVIDGINYAVANKEIYQLTVLSLSLGGNLFSLANHLAVENAVNHGLVTVVSAGNDGPGSNTLGQPGNADSIISVAAMTYQDEITSYSSQGGMSYTGKTNKPDISAPGGAFTFPMYSSDSNDQDGLFFTDQYSNDAQNMQGTSMACPAVSGAAALLIDALGGYTAWSYSRSQALQIKHLLLMTATETNRNRESATISADSPTLNRGGKDIHEGYGRINIDAAITAVTQSATLGLTYQDTLYSSTVKVDAKHAWARSISLTNGMACEFKLNLSKGMDCDLYLYSETPDTYGEPVILEAATTVGSSDEVLLYTAPAMGIYYLVVKIVSGSGQITLDLSDTATSNTADVSVSPCEGSSNSRVISARLVDQSAVTVWAQVENYNGLYYMNSGEVIKILQLFDDGAHNDGTMGDGVYANTLDITEFKYNKKYTIDIVCYDPGVGVNTTYYKTGGGFWKGNDVDNPEIVYTGASPDSIFQGQPITFSARIEDTSGISSVNIGLYDFSNELKDTITLYDDGNHNDLLANDFFFVGSYDSTSLNVGCYYYSISATDDSMDQNMNIVEKYAYINVTDQPHMVLADYIISINATYSWLSANNWLSTLNDDEFASISLNQGWNFPFYDATYSIAYIYVNGFISLQTGSIFPSYENQLFPCQRTSSPDSRKLIAPLWTDLIKGTGGVYYTLTSDYLLVEWRNVQHYDGYTIGSFEVILWSNGTIKFQYNNLDQNAQDVFPTCGLNYGSTSNLATVFYQIDQAIGTTKAVVFHYVEALDENRPSIGISLPQPNEILFGTMFQMGDIYSNEPLSLFQYRLYSYQTSTYITGWSATIQSHTLNPGNYRLETQATDAFGMTTLYDCNFTMLGDLYCIVTSVTDIDSNILKVTWSTAPNAESYKLYRSVSAITPANMGSVYYIVDSSITSYDDTSITIGQTYYYAIIGSNSYGDSWLYNSHPGLIPGTAPTVSFTINSSSIISGQCVEFTPSVLGGNLPMIWTWDFGDGSLTVNTQGIVVHWYTTEVVSIFTAILTVVDAADNEVQDTEQITVVRDVVPSVSFITNSSSIIVDQYVEFTPTVSGGNAPSNWTWNFGDGSLIMHTEGLVVHQFSTVLGSPFTVTLTVVDADGDSVQYSEKITVRGSTNPISGNLGLIIGIIAGVAVIGVISLVVILKVKKSR